MLDSCGFHAIYGLRILEQKSLITISNDVLHMHDRIEELGRYIVRRLHPHEPNKHSRLWIREEIEELLSNDYTGTEASTCTGLDLAEVSPEIVMKGLGKLKKLKYLILIGSDNDRFPNDLKFEQARQYFPNSLQFLSWNGYPGFSLPQTFLADNLVALELPDSKIVQLWENGKREVLKKLRFLDLAHSKLRTLDLGMTPNLERLDLGGCDDLRQLRVPVGCLQRLAYLDLVGCSRFPYFSFIKRLESFELFNFPELFVYVECLKKLPSDPSNNLTMLRFKFDYFKEQPSTTRTGLKCVYLDLLQTCTKLESVTRSICGLQHLRHLTFNGCITDVPNDIDQLKCLEQLTFLSARITYLPNSVCRLKHLNSLKLKDCVFLLELPENLGWLEHLEELSLSSTRIRRLPDSICMLIQLKSLTLISCAYLIELPKDFGQLECLEKLNLSYANITHLPDTICMLKHLKSLELRCCRFLEKLPEDIGQLECLEKLNLTKCAFLGEIPNSICKMKCLRYFDLSYCSQVERLPLELGSLKLLKELNMEYTGISYLPQSICSLEGLHIVPSKAVLQSCFSESETETSETDESTELSSQTAENDRKRSFTEHEATNTQSDST